LPRKIWNHYIACLFKAKEALLTSSSSVVELVTNNFLLV